MTKKINYIYTVGKRKEASARVRLYHGKGENLINGMPIEKYFPGEVEKNYWLKPFRVADAVDKYYITAKVEGSGKAGQLTALVLGISRALSLASPEKFRHPLKKMGLLTRDSRIRERRMVGTGGKSRRTKQSPKR
jgi:small subunit ribosomal protein S9